MMAADIATFSNFTPIKRSVMPNGASRRPDPKLKGDVLADIALPEKLRELSLQVIGTEAVRLLETVQGDYAEAARLIEAELEVRFGLVSVECGNE